MNASPMHRPVAWFLPACLALAGCSPAPQPPAPVAHVDRDHDDGGHGDHGHDDDKGHGHEHDHEHDGDDHAHPETLSAALAELEKLCGQTRDALAAGDLAKADGPVHMVGHLLEDITALAAAARPGDAAAQASAAKAIEEIFDCFDKLDTAIHAAEGESPRRIDYADFAPRIEAATATLREIAR